MSISISYAARLLRTSQQDIYQQLRNGQLTSKTIDGRRVITENGLKEYQTRKRTLKAFRRKNRG